MSILALGISHHSATLDLRERLAFGIEKISPLLRGLKQSMKGQGHEPEVALLSTCNRTELYWHAPSCAPADSANALIQWISEQSKVGESVLRQHAYQRTHGDAARHAFRVASGLDSMVLGEPQILGQMKTALRAANEAGTVGTTLQQLFQRSFTVAKAVRSNTQVGSNSVSMAAAAVRLALRLFGPLGNSKILFVGAGEMIDLAATHFAAHKPAQMSIANRTPERAQALCQRLSCSFLPLSQLGDSLAQFDVVISCTASTVPIIGLGAVKRALKARRSKPLLMIDLAVPRDIEAEVRSLNNVYLYSIDDLAEMVKDGRNQRQAAVAQAEMIVDSGVSGFMQWIEQRQALPIIQQLQCQAEQWRSQELDRAKKQLARGQDIALVLEAMSRGLSQKFLHGAFTQIRSPEVDVREQAEKSVSEFFLQHSRSKPSLRI